MSPETLTLALQCVESTTFSIAATELDAMAARVATARRELAEAIAEQNSAN